MKIEISDPFPNGIIIITFKAENQREREALKLIIKRYDNVPFLGEPSILGGWNSNGSYVEMKKFPLTKEEWQSRRHADTFIASCMSITPVSRIIIPEQINLQTPLMLMN